MLPVLSPAGGGAGGPVSSTVSFARRLAAPEQWDVEFAAWTALQLLTAPATAHRHVAYHRSAKSQWARDDPAFAALLGGLVAGAAAAAGATFAPSVGVALRAVVRAVLLDYVGVGVGLATVGWLTANHLLRRRSPTPDPPVEWLYAFDVHCNAFLPLVLELHCGHVALAPLLLRRGHAAAAAACALWAGALAHYHYITFLGYAALPGVDPRRAAALLWPAVAAVLAVAPAAVAGFNPARLALGWYFG